MPKYIDFNIITLRGCFWNVFWGFLIFFFTTDVFDHKNQINEKINFKIFLHFLFYLSCIRTNLVKFLFNSIISSFFWNIFEELLICNAFQLFVTKLFDDYHIRRPGANVEIKKQIVLSKKFAKINKIRICG